MFKRSILRTLVLIYCTGFVGAQNPFLDAVTFWYTLCNKKWIEDENEEDLDTG